MDDEIEGEPPPYAADMSPAAMSPLGVRSGRLNFTLTTIIDAVQVGGTVDGAAKVWGFAIEDGEETLAATGEKEEAIWAGRIDTTDETTVGTAAFSRLVAVGGIDPSENWYYDEHGDTPSFSGISDHWHIFAHGYHWVACSLTEASEDGGALGVGVLLVQFSMDADGIVSGVVNHVIQRPESGADYYPAYGAAGYRLMNVTYDLFMVDETGGVAVGIWHRSEFPDKVPDTPKDDQGTTILRVAVADDGTWDHTAVEKLACYGSAYGLAGHGHSNGASALKKRVFSRDTGAMEDGHLLIAPEWLETIQESAILLIKVDDDWMPVSIRTLLPRESGYNFCMSTFSPLRIAGFNAFVYKKTLCPTTLGGGDEGEIILQILPVASVGDPVSLTLTDSGTRPHAIYRDGSVIVCWDHMSSTGEEVLLSVVQVDVSFSVGGVFGSSGDTGAGPP